MELDALNALIDEISGLGATLVAVSPQAADINKAFREEKKLRFDILSDPGNAVAHQYGIRHRLPDDLTALYTKFGINLPEFNGDDSWTLPMPACLIIDAAGVVRHTDINADYTIRPEPTDTLAALKTVL